MIHGKNPEMMSKILYSILVASTVIAFTNSAKVEAKKDDMTTSAPVQRMDQDMDDSTETKDYDLKAVMRDCNDSFIVEMSFLMSLNESGSFPDETDKTSKCYLRCVLENLNILSSEGQLDAARTGEIYSEEWKGTPRDGIEEIATMCAERNEPCMCDRSYNYLKCVFSMKIEKYEKTS